MKNMEKAVQGGGPNAQTEALLSRDYFCAMCGVSPGDIDDVTGHPAKFLMSDAGQKKTRDRHALRLLCSTCNRGARLLTTDQASLNWLLNEVGEAGQDEQQAVLRYLQRKFGNEEKAG